MIVSRALRCVGFSLLFVVLSPAFASDRKLCSDEIRFVRLGTMVNTPSAIAHRYGVLDAFAGLQGWEMIRRVADARNLLTQPGIPEAHLEVLSSLREEHFRNGQIFVRTELGISAWKNADEFEAWMLRRADLLGQARAPLPEEQYDVKPKTGFDWLASAHRPVRVLLEALAMDRGLPGLDARLLNDLRIAYARAVENADIVMNREALRREGQALRIGGLNPDRPADCFDRLCEAEARIEGSRLLPITLHTDGRLHIDDANASNVLRMLVRYPLVQRLVSSDVEGRMRPALERGQLITAALFPELVPYLENAPRKEGDHSMIAWFDTDTQLLSHYRMNVGDRHPFELSATFPVVLSSRLIKMGLDERLGFVLSFTREETLAERPGGLRARLELEIQDQRDVPADLSDQEISELEKALASVFADFRAFDGKSIRVRRDKRPLMTGDYWLDIPGADVALLVHAFEVASEFERYENNRR